MDEYRENAKKVQKALNQDAAFIQPDPYLAQRVLNTAKKEGACGIGMKRKMSLGTVLVIILLSLSLVAGAAVAIHSFLERAAFLQKEKGDMSYWTLNDKIELIVSMKESGVDMPEEQVDELLNGDLPEEEANHIADRLIVEKKSARKALEQTYGFTRTTFTFFSTQVDFVENTGYPEEAYWLVTYQPLIYEQNIGCYYVKVRALTQEILSVEWQHDNAFSEEDRQRRWHSKYWDAALVDGIITFDEEMQTKKQEMENIKGEFSTWSLQDKAQFDQLYLDSGYPLGDYPINVLPEGNDLSAEEAVSFAKTCIEETYRIDENALSQFRIEETLFKIDGADEKLYIIEFHHPNESEYYAVEFSSESRTVDLCAHYVNQVFVAPPSAADADASVDNAPIIPDNIMETAKMALKEEYGLTDDALRFFDATINAENDGWYILFDSNTINSQIVGIYTVFYSKTNQRVEKVEWEFDSIYPTQEKHTYWIENSIWGPHEMNCFAQLRIQTRKIVSEAGGENLMSFEQRAEYDRLYREAGYDRSDYYHGVPGMRDIEYDEALSNAKKAVASKWKVSLAELDSCEVLYEFDVSNPDQHVWRIRFLVDQGESEYTVLLDSETGEVIECCKGIGTNG